MPSTTRSRRIDVRVAETQDALIREAAAGTGETVTGFLLGAAQQRAPELLDAPGTLSGPLGNAEPAHMSA